MYGRKSSSVAHGRCIAMAALLLVAIQAQAAPDGTAAQAAQVPQLGAHTLLWHGDAAGSSPATTDPITTQANGSSLLVFNAGFASNAEPPSDPYANHWEQLGEPVVYDGYDGAYDVKAYVVARARGGSGHTVTIVKSGEPTGEITMPFVEIRNAGVLHSVVSNYPRYGAVLTSGSVTTTGPATLVAAWFGDAPIYDMEAVPDNGFTVVESLLHLPPNSAVQCAVAYREVSTPGTYNVTWSGSPTQGAVLWLLAFQNDPVDADVIFRTGFE